MNYDVKDLRGGVAVMRVLVVGGPRPLAAPFPLTLALSHIGEREICGAVSRGVHPPADLALLARAPLR